MLNKKKSYLSRIFAEAIDSVLEKIIKKNTELNITIKLNKEDTNETGKSSSCRVKSNRGSN